MAILAQPFFTLLKASGTVVRLVERKWLVISGFWLQTNNQHLYAYKSHQQNSQTCCHRPLNNSIEESQNQNARTESKNCSLSPEEFAYIFKKNGATVKSESNKSLDTYKTLLPSSFLWGTLPVGQEFLLTIIVGGTSCGHGGRGKPFPNGSWRIHSSFSLNASYANRHNI
jgi:hypothetical protein